jgi:DNA-binding transcriptional regulator/RsmH inhibitor MraZ
MADILGMAVVRMEATGRIRLPKTLAHSFGELGYFRTRRDGPYYPEAQQRAGEGEPIGEISYPYVELFSEEGIGRLSNRYTGDSLPRDDEDSWKLRAFSEELVPVSIQAKGRLVLPKAIREHGGFSPDKPVLMLGGGECVELWDFNTYQSARQARKRRSELETD